MAENTGARLTQDAFDRLTQELGTSPARTARKSLTASRRHAMRVTSANGGYHAARDEQAKNEAPLKQLKHLLETASATLLLTTAWWENLYGYRSWGCQPHPEVPARLPRN